MLSFLQNEGVQGLLSLLDNSADIRLCSITDEPEKVDKDSKSANTGKLSGKVDKMLAGN